MGINCKQESARISINLFGRVPSTKNAIFFAGWRYRDQVGRIKIRDREIFPDRSYRIFFLMTSTGTTWN
jgi:hypothetical protein